jgi:hypothetical protein
MTLSLTQSIGPAAGPAPAPAAPPSRVGPVRARDGAGPVRGGRRDAEQVGGGANHASSSGIRAAPWQPRNRSRPAIGPAAGPAPVDFHQEGSHSFLLSAPAGRLHCGVSGES